MRLLSTAYCQLYITAGRELHPAPKILLNSLRIALWDGLVKLSERSAPIFMVRIMQVAIELSGALAYGAREG
jgi:hypothetical protein